MWDAAGDTVEHLAGAISRCGFKLRGDRPPELNKQGKMALRFPSAWVKSPSFTAGQCPVMHYNRELMMAILWDRMPYLTPLVNTEIIPLERAVEAYRSFHEGSAKKYVIDPHNTTKVMSARRTRESEPAQA
ncbi:MAG: hypothetical protein ACXU9D_07630 [Xanthobacteraceae bacterium]